jgi:hypothetical protein
MTANPIAPNGLSVDSNPTHVVTGSLTANRYRITPISSLPIGDGNVFNVADIAALKLLDTSQWTTAIVASDAAKGTYVWRLGDYQAQHDAEGGADYWFVKAAAVATTVGIWLRTDLNDIIANSTELGITTGTVSDAVALVNAQRINAWLAAKDCRVFDWRADEIGIAETVREGRDGNGIIGVPGGTLFGAVTAGARAKWQGASGGVMFLARNTLNTVDLDSPSIFGITADGNNLAGKGFEFSGVMKPMADALHVTGLVDSVNSYAYHLRHNPDASGGQVNCCYGGKFGSLTCQVSGSANGFLLNGLSGASGTGVTFCQFDYCHVTCTNGYSFVFQKGDDNVFTQLGVSRAAGGTNGYVLFNTAKASSFFWVGNVIHNANLSKTDGTAMQIVVSDDGCMGNSTTYNGVDFAPTLSLGGGSLVNDNYWHFLGQSDYAGAFTTKPKATLPPLYNEESGDPLVLDWYEEGAVASPTVAFGGASVGVTYGTRFINWTRIGNRVFVNGSITLTAKGSSTGAVTITGLPFSAAAVGGSMAFSYFEDLASGIAPYGTAASTTIVLRKGGATTIASMTDADFTNTTRLDFGGVYQVA